LPRQKTSFFGGRSVVRFVLRVVALALQYHLLKPLFVRGLLRRAHARVAGREAFRADASAAESLLILHHVRPAVLAGTSHKTISSLFYRVVPSCQYRTTSVAPRQSSSPRRNRHVSAMAIARRVCYNLTVMKAIARIPFKKINKRNAKRALVAALALITPFLFMPASLAEDAAFAPGDCSDDVLRAETRLSDLGYFTGVVNGLWEQSDADALSQFALVNGVDVSSALSVLYSVDALFPTETVSSVFQSGSAGFVLTRGSLMPWSEVVTRLVAGESYTVTSCYSGIQLHMDCVSVDGYAKMQPSLEWDYATLLGFFSSGSSSEKQPVTVSIDGILVAASIQAAPPSDDGALPVYNVFFHESVSGVNGIPDAEHESVVLIASGS